MTIPPHKTRSAKKPRQKKYAILKFEIHVPAETAVKLNEIWAHTGREIILDPRGGKIAADFLVKMIPVVSEAMRNPQNFTIALEWMLAAQRMMLAAAKQSNLPKHPGFVLVERFFDVWSKALDPKPPR